MKNPFSAPRGRSRTRGHAPAGAVLATAAGVLGEGPRANERHDELWLVTGTGMHTVWDMMSWHVTD